MPTYAYACTTCDHRFEVRQSFSDAAIGECPACAGAVRKLFNTVGIVFKGSGFYRTDSRTAPSTGKDSASTDSSTGGKDTSSTAGGGSSSSTDSGAAGKGTEPPPKKSAQSKAPAGSSSAA